MPEAEPGTLAGVAAGGTGDIGWDVDSLCDVPTITTGLVTHSVNSHFHYSSQKGFYIFISIRFNHYWAFCVFLIVVASCHSRGQIPEGAFRCTDVLHTCQSDLLSPAAAICPQMFVSRLLITQIVSAPIQWAKLHCWQ